MGSNITEEGLAALPESTKKSLKVLDLINVTSIKDWKKALEGLESLEVLDLSYSNITEAGLAALSASTKKSLKQLYLRGVTSIKDWKKALAGLESLEVLGLGGTDATRELFKKAPEGTKGMTVYLDGHSEGPKNVVLRQPAAEDESERRNRLLKENRERLEKLKAEVEKNDGDWLKDLDVNNALKIGEDTGQLALGLMDKSYKPKQWAQILALMESLEVLYLRASNITDEGLAALPESTKKSLRVLNLGGVTSIENWKKALEGFDSLEGLYLSDSNITEAGLAALHASTKKSLRNLNLSGVKSIKDWKKALEGFDSLEGLYLSDSNITEEGLAALSASTKKSLRTLYLGGVTSIKDWKKALAGLESLEVLGLGGTDATRELFKKAPEGTKGMTVYLDGHSEGPKNVVLRQPAAEDESERRNRLLKENRERLEKLKAEVEKNDGDWLKDLDVNNALKINEKTGRLTLGLMDKSYKPKQWAQILALMESLEVLYLRASNITEAGLAALSASTKKSLKVLDLINATSIKDWKKALAGLESLEVLDLSYSNITEEGLAALSASTKKSLKVLDLINVTSIKDWKKALEGLESLEALDLWGSNITEEGLAALSASTKKSLRVLNLGGVTSIKDWKKALAGLESLEVLDLSYSNITEAGLAALSASTKKSLKQLYLRGVTSIKDWKKALAGLESLEVLGLGGADATRELFKKAPEGTKGMTVYLDGHWEGLKNVVLKTTLKGEAVDEGVDSEVDPLIQEIEALLIRPEDVWARVRRMFYERALRGWFDNNYSDKVKESAPRSELRWFEDARLAAESLGVRREVKVVDSAAFVIDRDVFEALSDAQFEEYRKLLTENDGLHIYLLNQDALERYFGWAQILQDDFGDARIHQVSSGEEQLLILTLKLARVIRIRKFKNKGDSVRGGNHIRDQKTVFAEYLGDEIGLPTMALLIPWDIYRRSRSRSETRFLNVTQFAGYLHIAQTYLTKLAFASSA